MLFVAFRETKNRHDPFAPGRLDVSAGRAKCLGGVRQKLLRDLGEGRRFAFFREIVLVRDVTDDGRDFARPRERVGRSVAPARASAWLLRDRRGRSRGGRGWPGRGREKGDKKPAPVWAAA